MDLQQVYVGRHARMRASKTVFIPSSAFAQLAPSAMVRLSRIPATKRFHGSAPGEGAHRGGSVEGLIVVAAAAAGLDAARSQA